MNESSRYPLIIRGPESTIEIPPRFQQKKEIQTLIHTTRTRFSSDIFTLEELLGLLGDTFITDASQVEELDLEKAIIEGHTAILQLTDNMRWRIRCLMEMFESGYSAIRKDGEKRVGVFHTGSHMPFGVISEQYLIHDPMALDGVGGINTLQVTQKQQNDPTIWMNRTF